MTRKKKQKSHQKVLSKAQPPIPDLEGVGTDTDPPKETAPGSTTITHEAHQTEDQDEVETVRRPTVLQGPPPATEAQLDSAPSSDSDGAQQVLAPGAATASSSVRKKKKKKSKKSKSKANNGGQQQPNVLASSATAAASSSGTIEPKQGSLPAPEMPYKVNQEEPHISSKAKGKLGETTPEVLQEQINPNFKSFSDAADDYYAQKDSLYAPRRPWTLSEVVTKTDQDEAKKQPVETTAQTYSPGSHRREMLKAMKNSGYILDDYEEAMEGDDELSQAEDRKPKETMTQGNLLNLKKLLHVSKTAVNKEQGSHERAAILNSLPPDIVEGYVEGSLGFNTARFKRLDGATKSQIKRLVELDVEEKMLKATLKENEDDVPESLPYVALDEADEKAVSFPAVECAMDTWKDAITEQLAPEAHDEWLEKAEKMKRAVRATLVADDLEKKKKAWTQENDEKKALAQEAEEKKASAAEGLVELHQQMPEPGEQGVELGEPIPADHELRANIDVLRQDFDRLKENQKPTGDLPSLKATNISPPRQSVSQVRIRHGDGTEERLSLSRDLPGEPSNSGAPIPTPDLSPASGMFPQLFTRPISPKEISWQWPGKPTPNVVHHDVLYTQLPNSPEKYKAVFQIHFDDQLVTNTAESCIEIVRRNGVDVWARESRSSDSAAAKKNPGLISMRDPKVSWGVPTIHGMDRRKGEAWNKEKGEEEFQ